MANRPLNTHAGAQPRQGQTNYVNQNLRDKEFLIVYGIFRGGMPGYIPLKRKAYDIGKYRDLEVKQVNLTEAAKSYPNNDPIPIIFTEDEAKCLSQPHSDGIVVELEISKYMLLKFPTMNGIRVVDGV